MRHAVVIFTKVPATGKTKTRLTEERGGIFTPEEAREFYEASLLDVIDACCASGSCDVYLCHDKDGEVAYLKGILEQVSRPGAIRDVFPDTGATFDKGMQYAVDRLFEGSASGRLADSVIILGGDMPALQPGTIRAAVQKLERLAAGSGTGERVGGSLVGPAMVVSADQDCGFNILGYTCATPFNFDGVFYNMEGVTALDMISLKAAEQGVPLGILEMVPDVDLPVDLAGFLSVVRTMQLAARHDPELLPPRRTIAMLEGLGLQATAPVPA